MNKGGDGNKNTKIQKKKKNQIKRIEQTPTYALTSSVGGFVGQLGDLKFLELLETPRDREDGSSPTEG